MYDGTAQGAARVFDMQPFHKCDFVEHVGKEQPIPMCAETFTTVQTSVNNVTRGILQRKIPQRNCRGQ